MIDLNQLTFISIVLFKSGILTNKHMGHKGDRRKLNIVPRYSAAS